jgi:hypothetical protein
MGGVRACGSRDVHFNPQDEEDLRKEPTTSAILDKARRDAGVGGPRVDVRGDDKTWRETKTEQKHLDKWGVAEIANAAGHALHLAEFSFVEKATAVGFGAGVGAGVVIGGSVVGLGLGLHQVVEAHHKGEEQRVALAKDELHVAMLTHLALPDGYKAKELAARAQAGQSAQSTAQKMATPLASIDKPLVAVMQHHADLGMRAARDFIESGVSKEKFLAAHPAIAEAYKKDPAFHDGFEALVWAKNQTTTPTLYKETLAAVESRDCRYAQTSVTYRP